MSIVIALLIFSFIVIFHELGHFTLARANGVEVTEFSLGMGPRLFTFCKTDHGMTLKFFASSKYFESREDWQGKTKYSLKILPFGGSCIMLGEDDVVDAENAFCNKNVYQRMSIVFAGPFFNFILAFILSIIITAISGFDRPVITDVEPGMPIAEAGIQAGDEIVKINKTKIVISREIGTYLMFNPLKSDEPVDIVVKRDGEKHEYTVKPTFVPAKNSETATTDTEEKPAGTYRLGFGYNAPREKGNFFQVMKYSTYEVKYWISTTLKSLGMLITGRFSKDDISGPVGIVSTVGEVVNETRPYGISSVLMSLIYFCILLSANLGVMNLLPIPALDGGRLLFQIVEVILRKPIDQKKEGIVTMIGFALLMVLMVLVMFNDIMKLFGR